MKVIGAGLPRTATLTQKVALETLGFGPCYHMVNILQDLDLVPAWRELFEGGKDWSSVFDGYPATVDWPGSFFHEELVDAYPDAKVLLSVRDGAAWERSMGNTIWGVIYGDNLMHDLSSARSRVDSKWRDYMQMVQQMWESSGLMTEMEGAGSGAMAKAMEAYNEKVKRTVPADRLLVWNPADGWEPLCEFLEAPVPETPLPHTNESKEFGDRIIDAAMASLTNWWTQEQQAKG